MLHIHKWVLISAQNGVSRGMETTILRVCWCGKYRTERIDGHFAHSILRSVRPQDAPENLSIEFGAVDEKPVQTYAVSGSNVQVLSERS
jgi:hypothetical protein